MGQSKKNRRIELLVQWKGFGVEDATWEKETSLWQFQDKIDEYLAAAIPTRTLASSSGGGLLAP